METRKEKYAKYRQEIKMSAPSDFPPTGHKQAERYDPEDKAALQSMDYSAQALSCDSFLATLEKKSKPEENSKSPYERYLTKRGRALFIKIILFVFALAGLVAWYFILKKGN